MIDRTLGISNLTDRDCANRVEGSLNAIPGVFARVSFAEGIVRIAAKESVPDGELVAAVRAAGFEAFVCHGVSSTGIPGDR